MRKRLERVLANYLTHGCVTHGAALAFYALFVLLPVPIFVVWGAAALVMGYLPQVAVALVVLVVALGLSRWAAKLATATFGEHRRGRFLVAVTRYAILFFGFAIGLNELGVGEALVTVAVAAVLGGTALAIGLAFGLGGHERAQRLIEETEGS